MTSPTNPVGDAVRFVDDERLDIPDARALQTLIYEYMADALGGLMGETSGALTDITFTTGDNAAIGIGECTLCGFKRRTGSSARVRGGIFHYDPTSNYQAGSTTVDLSAYVAGTDNAFLWFRRVELPADLATRHKYDSTAEREKTFSMNTRYRTKLAFGASYTATASTRPSPPDELYDWFAFAQVVSWDGTDPVIQPFHPLDAGIIPADYPATALPTPWAGSWLRKYAEAFETPPSYQLGLAQFMTFLGQRLAFTMDGAWLSNVTGAIQGDGVTAFGVAEGGGASFTRGVKQLDADLTTLESSVTAVAASASDALNGPVCIGTYYVNWTGAIYELESSSESDDVTHTFAPVVQGAGYSVTITITTTDADYNQISFHVQPNDANAASAATNAYQAQALAARATTDTSGGTTTKSYTIIMRRNDGSDNVVIGTSFCLSVFGSRTV